MHKNKVALDDMRAWWLSEMPFRSSSGAGTVSRDFGLRLLLKIALVWADCEAMLNIPHERQPLALQKSHLEPRVFMNDIRRGIGQHLRFLQLALGSTEIPPIPRARLPIHISVTPDLRQDLVETITRLRAAPNTRTLMQEQALRAHKLEARYRQQILQNIAARNARREAQGSQVVTGSTGTRRRKERVIPLVPALPLRAPYVPPETTAETSGRDSAAASSAPHMHTQPAARQAKRRQPTSKRKTRKTRSTPQEESDTDTSIDLAPDTPQNSDSEDDLPPTISSTRPPARPVFRTRSRAQQSTQAARQEKDSLCEEPSRENAGPVAPLAEAGEPRRQDTEGTRQLRPSAETVSAPRQGAEGLRQTPEPDNGDGESRHSTEPVLPPQMQLADPPVDGATMTERALSVLPPRARASGSTTQATKKKTGGGAKPGTAPKRKRGGKDSPVENPELRRGKRQKIPNTLYSAFKPS